MHHAFLLDGIRTPVGSFGGSLSSIRTDDLAAFSIQKLLEKHPQIDPATIADCFFGCANQAGEDNRNVARMAVLLAGLPVSVPGETVNRLCASGMAAAIHAKRAVNSGDGELFLAGGVEHMTRGPYVLSKSAKPFGSDAKLFDTSFGWRFINPKMEALHGTEAMGETAENLVDLYQISRDDQDLFAFRSQQKAAAARAAGRLAEEISPIEIQKGKGESQLFSEDEFIKPATSLEGLSKLKPAFRKQGGTVTAGNSSGLNDGACALLIGSESAISRNDFSQKVRIVSSAVVGVAPRIMGIGPVEASKMALQKAGISLKNVDVIELNEAFAAQSLACIRALQLADDDPRINPNGGAIALGHPLGMSGARILLAAANELQRTGGRFALCAMCIGVGQGYAVVLENHR